MGRFPKKIPLFAGLAALLLPLVANAAAVSCETAQIAKREYTDEYIKSNCTTGDHQEDCKNAYKGIRGMYRDYMKRTEEVCGQITENTKKADSSGQKDALESQKNMLNSSKASVDDLVSLADKYLSQDLPSQSKPLATRYKQSDGDEKIKKNAEVFMASNYEDKFRNHSFDEKKSQLSLNRSSVTSELHLVMHDSSNFIRDLIRDKMKRVSTSRMLESHGKKVEQDLRRLDQVPTPTPTAAAAKGPMDLATLAALAGPAAGLAQAMMQKKSASGVSDSATATPPQPAAEKPTNAASSKLGNAAGSKTGPVADQPKTAVAEKAFAEAVGADFGSTLEDAFSGISSPGSAGRGAAAGASSGASSSGGGAGGSGSERVSPEKSRTPASTNAATDEALQSFGGGGGLNFAGGGGAETSTAEATPADDSMKEMLNGMETALDSEGDLSGFGEQADASIAAQDSESLFPRVSAAHVRSLKRGELVHSVGESVVDE
jgi:hypothetical protein